MTSPTSTKKKSGLALYTQAAEASSAVVIGNYSTSFGWATKLLGPAERHHVRNIYALVRVADEIVDGAAAEALSTAIGVDPHAMLDKLEQETYRAVECGFSANLVVHAFAYTAREVGIKRDIIQPFFNSMRTDLLQRVHDKRSFQTYIYGSAEVVGLMCLAVFVRDNKPLPTQAHVLVAGARSLGAAFQKVNFLRDLSADVDGLGRSYFPGVRIDTFSEIDKKRICDDIDDDLARAAATLPLLPLDARRAVGLAHGLFASLNAKIRKTPSEVLKTTRIRVSDPEKFLIAARVILGGAK